MVSSSHTDPMEEFSRLTQQQHSQQHQHPHKLPKWFSPNILRYYVLVHDVTEQAEAKYAVELLNVKCVKCKNDYSVQNDESLHGHCTNERRVRKRDK